MKVTEVLRSWAYERRQAQATERIATACETLARLAQDDYDRLHARPPARPVEFGVMDIDAINKDWHQRRVEDGLEDDNGNPL